MGKITGTNSPSNHMAHRVDPVIDGALINWGRWNSVRHGGRQVNAMFRMVKPSQTWDVAPVVIPVDIDMAWLAEKVICNPGFYPRARALLTNHYVFATDQRQTCKQLGLHRSAYDEERWRSCFIFWNRYTQRGGT